MKRRRQVPSNPSEQDQTTGSSTSGEPVYLAAGRLRRSHGIKGEMLMDVLTDFPERLQPGKIVYVGDNHDPMTITTVRGHDRELIIRLESWDTPEATAPFRNTLVYVRASELPALPEDEYYHHQLIGMKVVEESGQVLGELITIHETGANDVYIVQTPEGKELLLPAIEEVVLDVDLKRREMRVRPPEWS